MEIRKEYKSSHKTKHELMVQLSLLAQEKPFNKITVKELCEKANLSRNAYYCYYNNIDNQLEEIERLTLTEIENVLQRFINGTFPQNMFSALESLMDMMIEWGPLSTLLLETTTSVSFLDKLKDVINNYFFDYFAQFQPKDFEDVYDFYYAFVFDGIIDMLRLWMQDPTRITKDRFCKMIYSMLNRLIVFEK
ncbi:MAG: TetR family transcriptional regulator C-terminal domain-containing protein [Oscillospiraceae bacterium]|jgi:AcrR family transcriptional regulator|nr:TetR family transcriptional regulator C-terminal domain-containing protein [Oscillospiraceae bacterium]